MQVESSFGGKAVYLLKYTEVLSGLMVSKFGITRTGCQLCVGSAPTSSKYQGLKITLVVIWNVETWHFGSDRNFK